MVYFSLGWTYSSWCYHGEQVQQKDSEKGAPVEEGQTTLLCKFTQITEVVFSLSTQHILIIKNFLLT